MQSRKKIIITCGPASVPIDRVRRITNHSTGTLGIHLSNVLSEAGFQVICCMGRSRTCLDPLTASRVEWFETNDDLFALLKTLSAEGEYSAVLHVAALSDFKLSEIKSASGKTFAEGKIPSEEKELHLTLVPAKKVLPELRGLFPNAFIVGWKYELDGSQEEAQAAARAQLEGYGTDATILNGDAYGDGFLWLSRNGEVTHLVDSAALGRALIKALT